LSHEPSPERWERKALITGGLAGLTLILLTNILPTFAFLTDIFAVINILLFMCILFSPLLLIYGFFEGSKLSKAIGIIIYISSALLIGFMIANLACGDKYYSGLIVMPNEVSAGVITAIATILLIPLINIFSSIPIATWLGSLIYWKIYQNSLFYKAIIGSPLFTIPLFIVLSCEISRTAISRKSIVYIFDKTSGTLTQQRSPKVRVQAAKMLSAIIIFLILGLIIAGAFGIWNELEETNVSCINDFHLSAYSYYSDTYYCYLETSFSLIDVRGRSIASTGTGELSIFNKSDSLIFTEKFAFQKESFTYNEVDKKWVCKCRIPGEKLFYLITYGNKSITVFPRLISAINSGYAVLKINLTNGKRIPIHIASLEGLLNIDKLIRYHFRNDVALLQAELDKQWPFKAKITEYFRMGNYCWMLVESTEGGIIISPHKIYKYYILQSTNGGYGWNITWKSDDPYHFHIEIFYNGSFSEVRISTPYATFVTLDEGKIWHKY
jgi:hypothetical protein